jgi:hypothetical protein
MLKHSSGATTRTARPVRVPLDRGKLLAPAEVITSQETQLRYRIERWLGEGGFGQVYLASRIGRSAIVPEIVCVEIVYRCIGERRKRYESANEMIEALGNPPTAFEVGVLRTLKGVHLAFTGILSKRRSEAIHAARRAGAIVHGMPSMRTTVVVRGRPNPLQAAGRDAGLKLMEIKRLREKGHRITLLNETQFWRLAHSRQRSTGASPKLEARRRVSS